MVGGGVGGIGATVTGIGPVGADVAAATEAVVVSWLIDGTVGGTARPERPANPARTISVPVSTTTRTAPTATPTVLAVLTAHPHRTLPGIVPRLPETAPRQYSG